jgi:predicted Zn finger-like uncharacterized protein
VQITCPQCSTTYRLPEGSIPAEGRDVRCKQCAHVWHQLPLQEPAETLPFEVDFSPPEPQPVTAPEPEPVVIAAAEITEIAAPEPERPPMPRPRPKINRPLPKKKPEKKKNAALPLKIAFGVLVAATLLVFALSYYPAILSHVPFLRPVYQFFGIYESNMELFDVSLVNDKNGYRINCSIRNSGALPSFTPPVRVTLKDANHILIARSILRFDENRVIKPGESVACQPISLDMKTFKQPPANVILDIGNAFDLSLRN